MQIFYNMLLIIILLYIYMFYCYINLIIISINAIIKFYNINNFYVNNALYINIVNTFCVLLSLPTSDLCHM